MAENQDRYEIRDVLGQGAMGVVYRAWDTALNRLVALKVMAASLSSNAELRIRFYREARSAASLTHPNIVTVYDFGETTNRVFIAMELVEGKSLKDILKLSLALDQKLDVMVQICRALAFAHQSGVVHRDVKPGNVLVTNDQVVKILDFGVAHLASSELTQTGARLGTPEYMSPEMIEGAKVDHRSDIFSCGIVFYELLTATKPFYDDSLTGLMEKIISRELPPVSQLVPDVPPALDVIMHKMLQKKPAERYQSLEETIADLKELQGELLLTKVDRIRELKGLYQTLVGLQAEMCKDEFCRSVFDLELGRELKEAKESLRALSDPSHTSVSLQALDYGKSALQERTERFRTFMTTVLPERVARRDELIEQVEAALKSGDLEETEEILRLLQNEGCSEASLHGWRQRVQAAREEQERIKKQTMVADCLTAARERAERESYGPALEAVREALALDPSNAEAATLQRELSEALARKDRPQPLPVPPPPVPRVPKAELRRGGSEVIPDHPHAGRGVLDNLVEDFLSEAREDLKKKDYSSCRKNLKRVFQLSPGNTEADEMLARLDRVEGGEATVLASWKEMEQPPAPPVSAKKRAPVAENKASRPIEEVPAEPGPARPPIRKRGLIIASGLILLALLISIPFWLPRGAGSTVEQDRLGSLEHRVSRAISEQSYKTDAALPAVLEDIRSLASVKGGQSRADGYLRTIRESYLAAAKSREAQKDWQGALKNYHVLTSVLQVTEYQAKIKELEGLIQGAAGQSTNPPGGLPVEPSVQPSIQPPVQQPTAKPARAQREPSPMVALDQKIGEAMRAGNYSRPETLPPLLQDIRRLAEMPGGNQKAVAYLTAVQAFYSNEARRYEASGERKRALDDYRILVDTIGASEYEAKVAELSKVLESEPAQKEAEALDNKITSSLRNQNLLPPSRDNAWDLVGQLQRIRPDHPRISVVKTTIRQRLEARVNEAADASRFTDAIEQLKKLATYFPEDRSRWEQRELDIKKLFAQRELVLPARHLHGGADSCAGEFHFTPVSIRFSSSGNRNHSRSLAFGAMSKVQQASDRLTVTLKMGSWYDFQYTNATDAKAGEEWLRFRETLNASSLPR